MKTITLWQPWASLIACQSKLIETRSWSTKYRGPLAIHAAKRTMDMDAMALWWEYRDYIEPTEQAVVPYGMVVATCMLYDVIPSESVQNISPTLSPPWYRMSMSHLTLANGHFAVGARADQFALGDFTAGRFAWLLDDVVALPEPIQAIGHQGLWNWEIPTEKGNAVK